jgi:hypothetical protein
MMGKAQEWVALRSLLGVAINLDLKLALISKQRSSSYKFFKIKNTP